jgi:hypothetical protein
MYMNHTLSRSFDKQPHTEFSIMDDDAINAAHMIAAGFNTMNRNFMGYFVLGVVDTQAGTVQYDGKTEQIGRPELKQTAAEPSDYVHVSRDVLEAAYADHMAVREMLCESGVETIPVSAGVDALRVQINELRKQVSHEFHARSMYEQTQAQERESTRAELISFVKRAHAKKERLTLDEVRPDLEDRWRGMLDVLAKFLVITGEADASEGHAVARRLCEIEEEMP